MKNILNNYSSISNLLDQFLLRELFYPTVFTDKIRAALPLNFRGEICFATDRKNKENPLSTVLREGRSAEKNYKILSSSTETW